MNSEGMWTDERALIEALISLARSSVTHDSVFLMTWRDYAFGANDQPLSEVEALKALDWLEDRLEMPVNPDT